MDDTAECIQCEHDFPIDETICPICGFDDDSDEEPVIPFLYAIYKHFICIVKDTFDFDR